MERLEQYSLEIKSLQTEDYKRAIENGFDNKYAWAEYASKQKHDDIAQSIIEIADRYNVPLERVSSDFDITMDIRIKNISKNNTKVR